MNSKSWVSDLIGPLIGLGIGWSVGFVGAAIIAFWLSLVVKGIGKLIKLIR